MRKRIRLLASFIRLAWSISPSYVVLLCCSALVSGGRVFTNVVLPKFLIDELAGAQDIRMLALYVGLIVGANLAFAFLDRTIQRFLPLKSNELTELMTERMSEKIMNVEYSYLEDPYYLDLKERAMFAITNQGALENLVDSVANLIKNAVIIAGLLAIMFTLSPVLVILLTLSIGVATFIYSRFMHYQIDFFQQLLPTNRRYGYYVQLCFNDSIQKDARLYGMSDMLVDRVTWFNREINRWLTEYYRKQGLFMGAYGTLNDLQAALAYGYVGLRVLLSNAFSTPIGLGSFTMYVGAAISFSASTKELGMSVVSIAQMLGYLEPFAEFMGLPDAQQAGGVPFEGEIEDIRFEHVSFSYPKSDAIVLHDISFEIRGGEKISIVGLNGAGKTTLVKLLCRLYRPTSGRILINGRDIAQYDHASYMRNVAAVFQDYKLFAFTIDENITGKRMGSDLIGTGAVLKQTGLSERISELDEGIYTMLGRAYDENGTELSGGEQQKIAIARALYKDAPLIILDEPTSALDPLAEAEIYENFNTLIGGKTAIYISHRMSSSVFCDRILILDGGKVCDYDAHHALMRKKDGLYYKLFNSQAENYRMN